MESATPQQCGGASSWHKPDLPDLVHECSVHDIAEENVENEEAEEVEKPSGTGDDWPLQEALGLGGDDGELMMWRLDA